MRRAPRERERKRVGEVRKNRKGKGERRKSETIMKVYCGVPRPKEKGEEANAQMKRKRYAEKKQEQHRALHEKERERVRKTEKKEGTRERETDK